MRRSGTPSGGRVCWCGVAQVASHVGTSRWPYLDLRELAQMWVRRGTCNVASSFGGVYGEWLSQVRRCACALLRVLRQRTAPGRLV